MKFIFQVISELKFEGWKKLIFCTNTSVCSIRCSFVTLKAGYRRVIYFRIRIIFLGVNVRVKI